MEEVVRIATIYKASGSGSLAVVVPKEVRERMGIKEGMKLYVKIDDEGRIIYEPLEKGKP